MKRLINNFLEYVKIDTQSDPNTGLTPSTEKQKHLSRLLLKQLKSMDLEAFLDDKGYTYALIKSNSKKSIKPIGFIAHVDTSFDAPGGPVQPRIIEKYDGDTIVLNSQYQMHPDQFPSLNDCIGDDIIVTDGNTLLGADDKAGVAEIMELAYILFENPTIEHGDIYLCFTPDEEIGEGADHFNHDWFKADFAYTLDGSKVGGIEYENFNAASAVVTFTGKSIHPGSAKYKLINAQHLLFEFHQLLPKHLDPALTEHYEGFNHLGNIEGSVESATSKYIIRNHDKTLFENQKNDFLHAQSFLNKKYGYPAVLVTIKDSYYNMYEIIKDHLHIVDLAKQAITRVGLTPFSEAIRGGTDGARLTFDGLPCPNLGTGGYQFHGRFEFASIQQMQKAVEVIVEIVKLHSK